VDESAPYNPLSKRNLAASIVSKLLYQPPEEMPTPQFVGAGIYLIYYAGAFESYLKISEANRKGKFGQPIYMGKAIPAGGRKGLEGFDVPHGHVLAKRLKEHAEFARPRISHWGIFAVAGWWWTRFLFHSLKVC
jgi:hypothetical protein